MFIIKPVQKIFRRDNQHLLAHCAERLWSIACATGVEVEEAHDAGATL